MSQLHGPHVAGQPQGRYRRMWAEFEVEVVDVEALRTFNLHALNDEDGNFVGLVDMDDNERIQWALTRLFVEAIQAVEAEIGVRFVGGVMPSVRYLKPGGAYSELTLPAMPSRRDDGEFDGEWPPVAPE